MTRLLLCLSLAAALLGAGVGCAHPTGIRPLGIAASGLPLDLSRFMGDWYVVAHIPLSPERDAHDAVERYALRDDGTIDVRFDFCDGSSTGPARTFTMRAWVFDPQTNADWRVRPFWPLRFPYQIIELDEAYTRTVVRSGENVWIMAREIPLPEEEIAPILDRLASRGFDLTRMRRVPHADGSCRQGARDTASLRSPLPEDRS